MAQLFGLGRVARGRLSVAVPLGLWTLTQDAEPLGTTLPPPVVHGIPNCDTVKKARTWLAANGRDAAFHDFKKAEIGRAHV